MELTTSEYDTLVRLAEKAFLDVPDRLPLDSMLRAIETRNRIVRYALWVQWQDAKAVLPVGAEFPRTWPPELRARLQKINEPFTRENIETYVSHKASSPVSVLLTEDPNGLVGWRTLDQYFAATP